MRTKLFKRKTAAVVLAMAVAVILVFAVTLGAGSYSATGSDASESGTGGAGAANSAAGAGRVSIMFTSDMHSHLDADNGVGGAAKLKTATDQIRADYPGSFLFDGGDFSMGTAYQTIATSEASELRVMGAIGYDATTLGNHEFDYGASGLAKILQAAVKSGDSTPAILLSNINWSKTLATKSLKKDATTLKNAFDAYGVEEDYTIIKKNGVSIAVFGVDGHESIEDAPASGVKWTDYVTRAKKVVKEIKKDGKTDMIVCLSHSGVYMSAGDKAEDIVLAKEVPDIDVIISGHAHTTLAEPIVEGHTYIVSPGCYAQKLGHIVLKKSGSRYKLVSYKLVQLDRKVKEDASVNKLLAGFRAKADSEYFSKFGLKWEQKVVYNPYKYPDASNINSGRGEEPFGDLLTDSYIYALRNSGDSRYENIQVAIAPAGGIRGTFNKGYVTVSDCYNVESLGTGSDGISGFPLVNMYLTGKELKAIADVDSSVADIMPIARLNCSGLCYSYSTHRMFLNRTVDHQIEKADGTRVKVQDDKLYSCVTDMYTCRMISATLEYSKGLISIVPKDSKGNVVKDFNKEIVTSGGKEIKAWYALNTYVSSFKDGRIPAYYSKTHDRKVDVTNWNPWTIFKEPNKFGLVADGALALVILIIVLIVRKVRRRRRIKKLKYKQL